MLMPTRSVRRRGLWAASRLRLLGVVFMCVLLALVWLTWALFQQKFTHYDTVTLDTSTIGLQLPDRADVKIRGVEVGEVLNYTANPGGQGATVTLGIDPSQMDTIPANVTGAILPKTLFGEKYVSLEIPSQPSPDHIAPGAVISKTAVSTEVEQVLADLYPLLNTVQPADLNETLNAIATALEGRGTELGQSIVMLDDYLKKVNPQLPLFIRDLRETSTVSNTYADVMPQVASILRNTITTTTTLEDRSAQLHQLLGDVTAFSHTANRFLAANGDNLIQLGKVSRPVFDTLARYSPEFPCLLGGLNNLGKRVTQSFRDYTLHIVLETIPRQPRSWNPSDKPVYGEDRGPACGHLPNPPWSQKNPLKVVPNLNDGVNHPTGKGTDRAPVGYASPMAYAGSPAETRMLDQLIAPSLGVGASDVPDLGALLIGPMARGAKVSQQ